MRPLSASDVISVWELGQSQHPLERAITILSVACPDMTQHQLAALSIGQRDIRLLTLREITFGRKLNSLTECPKCHERLEFTVDIAAIRVGDFLESAGQEYTRLVGEYECRFRLPNSWDLAVVAGCRDRTAAREKLVQRCVLHSSLGQETVSCSELPPEAIAQLALVMSECDPQAEVLLNLDCPACGYSWQSLFDILTFFWTELAALAKRLLWEVHTLAQAYGWREADILSMSATRRQLYLEMVT